MLYVCPSTNFYCFATYDCCHPCFFISDVLNMIPHGFVPKEFAYRRLRGESKCKITMGGRRHLNVNYTGTLCFKTKLPHLYIGTGFLFEVLCQ